MVSKLLCVLLLNFIFCFSIFSEPQPKTELANAVQNQAYEQVKQLLNSHCDVNHQQVDGMTALHWAVHHDDFNLSKQLIESGADVNITNRYGVMPLSIACTNGNAEIVKLLLENGADPNATLSGGETVLMIASRVGKVEPVRALLNHGAKVDAKERNDQTALMWSVAEGHKDVVKILIDAGADLNYKLNSGFTPLLFAVREGHIDVVNYLLKQGADVNTVFRDNKKISPLILAVENGHFELAVELLKAGADPDDQRSGYTALHNICWVRKPDTGDDGDPAPVGSGNISSLEFVEIIVKEFGADVNAQLTNGNSRMGRINNKGATPFLFASKRADVPLMNLLIELGADPLLPNADNTTPLMAAAGYGTIAPGEEPGTEPEAIEAVKLILKHNGDVNMVDNNGETAMHGAAYKSFPEVVQLLVDNGADINIWNKKNKHGWTPLLIAQGYRPGNFKPSAETIAAIEKVMIDAGINPVDPPSELASENEFY